MQYLAVPVIMSYFQAAEMKTPWPNNKQTKENDDNPEIGLQ